MQHLMFLLPRKLPVSPKPVAKEGLTWQHLPGHSAAYCMQPQLASLQQYVPKAPL